jgi:hypothetical protein
MRILEWRWGDFDGCPAIVCSVSHSLHNGRDSVVGTKWVRGLCYADFVLGRRQVGWLCFAQARKNPCCMNKVHIPCAGTGFYRKEGSAVEVISSWLASRSLVWLEVKWYQVQTTWDPRVAAS